MIGISITSHIVVSQQGLKHIILHGLKNTNYVEIIFMKCDTTIVRNLIMCM